ncbi:NADP-dependent oxidoreductase [Actinomadura kijaniata]|uniref:NADP-dependent oxidoreductase n=1 Tax=Actinomadura kijaniata TaxID=46161 RepID=UPI003F1D3205
MRAVRIDRFGGPEVLNVVKVPDAEAGPEEVLVRVVASGVNPVDDKTREGAIGEGTPPLPMTLGWDVAGVVVDPGSSGLGVGERVIGMSHQLESGRGTWADLVALPARSVAAAPTALGLVEAATVPLAGLTALQTLDWLKITGGERLLVAGAAGAVGVLALQIARARGAHVDALVSRPEQVEVVRGHGAEQVVMEPTALEGRRYDAVFDTFGAFVTDAVADGGRYASIATQRGPVPDLSGRGVRTTVNQVREDGAGLADLVGLIDRGALRPRVEAVFGLHRVREAAERFARGGLNGRIVLSL